MAESLVNLIIAEFPELAEVPLFEKGIWLQNDSDGSGDYIAKWDYSQAIPESLLSYKR
jgi:hypothetical protein